MYDHRMTRPWFQMSACVAVVALSGCFGGGAGEHEVGGASGDRALMQTPMGMHDGFVLEACPSDDETFVLIGTGRQWWNDVAPDEPGRDAAVIDFGNELVTPITAELDSWTLAGGVGLPCRGDLPAMSAAGISDWAEMDTLIKTIGAALDERDLREPVEVGIMGPFVTY